MWAALRRHWQARQEASALARRAIPDALWRRTLKRFPFLAADAPTQQRLRRITSAALVLECTPEAFRLDPQQHLRPLLACLQEFGLSQASACAF